MFTFAATPVMVVGLLALFSWCTLWTTYESVQPQIFQHRVSNVAHLVMSVVMLLMVVPQTWRPLVTVVPLPVWMALFLLAAAWFVVLAVRARGEGWAVLGHHLSHAAMFGAMVWHLGGMAVRMVASGRSPDMMRSGGPMTGTPATPPSGGIGLVVAVVGLPFMTYLLVAAVLAVVRAVRVPAPGRVPTHAGHHGVAAPVVDDGACHEARPVGGAAYRLAATAEFAMSFGMFWMSVGLMLPLLPFLALLRF